MKPKTDENFKFVHSCDLPDKRTLPMKSWDARHEQAKLRDLFDISQLFASESGRLWLLVGRSKREKRTHARLCRMYRKFGRPKPDAKNLLYLCIALGTSSDYIGETSTGLYMRTLKHRHQLAECKNRGLDRCHRAMMNQGFEKFVFIPLLDLDSHPHSKKDLRFYEWKAFLLFRPTLNTTGQQGSFDFVKMIW